MSAPGEVDALEPAELAQIQPFKGASAEKNNVEKASVYEETKPITVTAQQHPGVKKWFHWHEPNTSKEEKRLILKLDWFLLSYSCLCYFIKWLDNSNVTNAYVSGMSEDLHFGPGNQLSWMNTFFTCGNLIGAPFANLIITVIRPRFWLPSCLLLWSVFVLGMYAGQTAGQFYALRFCCGLFESAAWPGITWTLGCWYRKSELARRSALFVISGVLGQMFSGYLQAALFSGMQGKGGLAAWRWLFIFDFLLAVPVAIYGFVSSTPFTIPALLRMIDMDH